VCSTIHCIDVTVVAVAARFLVACPPVTNVVDVVVEVARAPGVNRRRSAHKTVTHISVDLVIVLLRVDVTCHTSRVTMFVVYKQRSSLI